MSGFRIGNLWSIHLPSCFPSSCCPSACLHASLLVCLCLRQSETHKQGHNSVGTPYRKSICPVVIRPYLYMIRVMYICIHVYITYVYIMLYIYIYRCIHILCVYIYIYIYIEREREREIYVALNEVCAGGFVSRGQPGPLFGRKTKVVLVKVVS